MRILLKFDCESRISEKAKIYSLRIENKRLINQTFNDLQEKKRLKYTTESTLFKYSIFVVWKMINDKRKKRVVINIRNLNFITLFDVYSLFLQFDVISLIKECNYLFVIDCVFFFYQWRVHFDDKHKLTVVSHREQETFQIAIMSYKNSSSYVQRQIDKIFRELIFVKAFIDNIIIFSKDLDEHIAHLNTIFRILTSNDISINSKKAFLSYNSMQLLEQKVNSLELFIDEEKLKTVRDVNR